MSWRDLEAGQNLRLAERMLEQQAEINRLKTQLAELETALAATERTLDRTVSEAASDSVRLCVGTHSPIDPGNYAGPIHCLAHPHGYACVTAMYGRLPDSTFTADERATPGGTRD